MTTQSTTTKEALEPCPLCPDGGKPYFTKSVNGSKMLYVGCSQCGLQLKAMLVMVTPVDEAPTKDIVAIWNTRARVSAPIVAPEVDEALIRLLLDWRKWYSEDIFSPWTIEEAQAVQAQFPGAADRIAAASARGTIDRIVEDIQEGKHAAPASPVAPQQSDEARVTQERDDLSNEMSRCHEMLARFDGTYEEGMVCADTLEECLQRHLDALTPVITDDTVNGDD